MICRSTWNSSMCRDVHGGSFRLRCGYFPIWEYTPRDHPCTQRRVSAHNWAPIMTVSVPKEPFPGLRSGARSSRRPKVDFKAAASACGTPRYANLVFVPRLPHREQRGTADHVEEHARKNSYFLPLHVIIHLVSTTEQAGFGPLFDL